MHALDVGSQLQLSANDSKLAEEIRCSCALGKDMGRLSTESATAQLQRVVGYS
jgi:hypothetical protein